MSGKLSFGPAIRASRRSRKLTQSELAEKAEVSRQAVGLVESGGGRLSTLLAIQEFAPLRLRGLPPGRSFAERLRSARGNRTIVEASNLADLSANTWRELERGKGAARSLVKAISALSNDARIEPVLERRRGFKTVGGAVTLTDRFQTIMQLPLRSLGFWSDRRSFRGRSLSPALAKLGLSRQCFDRPAIQT